MTLAQFIAANSDRIISDWEKFARTCVPAASTMDLAQRRDDVAAMLKTIASDLDTPQTKREQIEKSKGHDDADVDSDTPANAHGTARAATGYTPAQMIAEFRALRASILRMWSEAQGELGHANLDELTRFNESIDQLLAESIARYALDVDRSKDLFLGILGHDLRNPLGAILTSASTMMAQEGPDWTHAKAASRIVRSATRMDEMIRDLLDFTSTRLGAGIPVEPADVDMEAICRQTIDEIVAFHPGSIVRFEASGNLRGWWDGGRLGQVASNLVANAYQHGTADRPVDVALRGEADAVVLTVHNQGPVIAARDLRDIFDPFRRLTSVRAQGQDPSSLGLGLYITQAIVSAHGGTIDVVSTDDGITFTVRLPRITSS